MIYKIKFSSDNYVFRFDYVTAHYNHISELDYYLNDNQKVSLTQYGNCTIDISSETFIFVNDEYISYTSTFDSTKINTLIKEYKRKLIIEDILK